MSSIRLFAEKHLDNIRCLFDTLYNDEVMTDVTLCCKNGSLKVHKLILAASSPYFKRVFMENHPQQTVFIMHGIRVEQLRHLVELVYKGRVDIPGDTLKSVYDLASDFDIKGVAVDGSTLITNNARGEFASEQNYSNLVDNSGSDISNNFNLEGRDTRYKGQKRVAVDYKDCKENLSEDVERKVQKTEVDQKLSSTEKRKTNNNDKKLGNESKKTEEKTTSSAWARKLRKFNCSLCPSSFKRASHLTRHQLVHTGERPYACNQCDKAFSRHDKLKHHIKKNHEPDFNPDVDQTNHYTIGQVRVDSPKPITLEQAETVYERSSMNIEKKAVPPLIKRPRGRPRLNPIIESTAHGLKRENYDITNLPYGDIEYLTNPLVMRGDADELEDAVIMEPLVEIKTSSGELNGEIARTETDADAVFLGNILENKSVAKIGECTISVASASQH